MGKDKEITCPESVNGKPLEKMTMAELSIEFDRLSDERHKKCLQAIKDGVEVEP